MNSRRFTDTPKVKRQMISTLTCTEEGVGDVRFGSQADICSAKRHVRFTLKSSQGLPGFGKIHLPPGGQTAPLRSRQ